MGGNCRRYSLLHDWPCRQKTYTLPLQKETEAQCHQSFIAIVQTAQNTPEVGWRGVYQRPLLLSFDGCDRRSGDAPSGCNRSEDARHSRTQMIV